MPKSGLVLHPQWLWESSQEMGSDRQSHEPHLVTPSPVSYPTPPSVDHKAHCIDIQVFSALVFCIKKHDFLYNTV